MAISDTTTLGDFFDDLDGVGVEVVFLGELIEHRPIGVAGEESVDFGGEGALDDLFVGELEGFEDATLGSQPILLVVVFGGVEDVQRLDVGLKAFGCLRLLRLSTLFSQSLLLIVDV